jgi:hypothetical protein
MGRSGKATEVHPAKVAQEPPMGTRSVSHFFCVGAFVLAHPQTSGSIQKFKHQLAQQRLVWGDRPASCSDCGQEKSELYKNYFGDAVSYISCKHPVFSVLFAPRDHPYSKRERAVTLCIGIFFSFLISVLIQNPDYATIGAVVISVVQFLAEQLATCGCVQHPCVHPFIRQLFEKIGNYIQNLVLLVSILAAWAGMMIFVGKNGTCHPSLEATDAGLDPTCDHNPGTHLCNPVANASQYVRVSKASEGLSLYNTLDCRYILGVSHSTRRRSNYAPSTTCMRARCPPV